VWITKAWQPVSPEVTVKGMDGSADGMLWNGSEDGNDKVSVRKMKEMPVKMETVTLIGKGGISQALCISCTQFTIKYIFFFCKVILDFKIYIFPWKTCFI
jgi:hypothetical protein